MRSGCKYPKIADAEYRSSAFESAPLLVQFAVDTVLVVARTESNEPSVVFASGSPPHTSVAGLLTENK